MTSPGRQDPHSHQRILRRQIPDRGISQRLSRRGHPAYRAGHRGHLRHGRRPGGAAACASRTPPPDTYYERLDNRIPGHGEDVARLARRPHPDGRRASERAACCCRSSPRTPSARSSSRSSSARAMRASAKAISAPCSNSIEADQIRRGVLARARRKRNERCRTGSHGFPRVEGRTSRQAHADLPDGHLRARDRQATASSAPPPISITAIRPPAGPRSRARCGPRAFDLPKRRRRAASPLGGAAAARQCPLQAADWWQLARADELSGAQCRRRSAAVRP